METAESKYLIFSLHGERFALDLAQIAEVMDPPPLWPIPLAPSCYPGAMNFHGAIVAVLDLAGFIGFAGAHPTEKVVVLDQQIAALAIQVERVLRIVQASEVDRQPPTDLPFAMAHLAMTDGAATLLDAKAIAADATARINE